MVPSQSPLFYRRHLPHWHPPNHPIFVTWRLAGSLPAELVRALKQSKAWGSNETPKSRTSDHMRREARRFRMLDRLLDSGNCGPLWLKDARVARCMVETLRFCERELRLYALHAYVVMANHVHVLFSPQAPLSRITRTIKAFSARKANDILGRKGQSFWQDESFDHWVRDEASFLRIRRYIEMNPVRAGLVQEPENWPWSSAAHPSVD